MIGLKSARDRGRMGGRPKGLSEKLNEAHVVLKHYISRMNLHLYKYLRTRNIRMGSLNNS